MCIHIYIYIEREREMYMLVSTSYYSISYIISVRFFIIDPRWSYNFSRLIEAHAVDTYGEFRDANEELYYCYHY